MVELVQHVTAIVPVRKGSQRVPGKNLRPFTTLDGTSHSLLSWKIEQLKQVIPAEHIIVTSDWDEALQLAAALGCTQHRRDDRLAGADAPFEELIALMASQVRTTDMMWTPVTSPFIGPSVLVDFLGAYGDLTVEQRRAGLLAVTELRNYFFMANRPLNFQVGGRHVQTQDIPTISLFDWGLACRPVVDVLETSYMFSATPSFYNVDVLANFDINEEVEFRMAQALVPFYLEREQEAKN